MLYLKVRNVQEGHEKTYECEYYKVIAHEHSCFFCKYCTDIWWDYTNGPYMWLCTKEMDTELEYFRTGCPEFEEDA